jgi:ABC-type branched-subunit amino acid transport system ATPase component
MRTLTLSGLDKSYGSARVLQGVDLTLRAGEVHALMGENGAGKSTLIKVLAGIVDADRMALTVDGEERRLTGPADAAALGLRFVHQEFNIVPSLSVAENILLSRQHAAPLRLRGGLARDAGPRGEALARFGIDHIDPGARAGSLSTGDRMLTVLAGLLATDDTAPSVFVMDEPTAALTHAEADRLFRRHRGAEGAGGGDPLCLAPHGGGGGDRRSRHGPAGRGGGAELPDGGDLEGRDHRGDDGSGVADAYPQRPGGHVPRGRRWCWRSQPLGRAGPRRGFSSGGARSSGSRGWKARGSRRSCARFWAICGRKAGASGWAVSRAAIRRRGLGARHRLCPARTAARGADAGPGDRAQRGPAASGAAQPLGPVVAGPGPNGGGGGARPTRCG